MPCKRQVFLALILITLITAGPARAEPDTHAEALFSRTLYLVRHGAYDIDQKTESEAGPGLTPLGIAQARLIAARLRGMSVHFALMTSSTLTRAIETAAVMHETLSDVPLAQSASWSECTPPFQNTGVSKKADTEEAIRCQETLDDVFRTYFVPAKHAEESDIVVAHGNVIRELTLKALGVDTKAWVGISVAHASLTVIRVTSRGTFQVLSVGDVGHIPPNMQSGSINQTPELVLPPRS
jgi:serine/threonine-protein phosphatase PGAM5